MKTLYAVSLGLAVSLLSSAVQAEAGPSASITLGDGRALQVESLSPAPDGGVDYVKDGVKFHVRKGYFSSAELPKPQAVVDADAALAKGRNEEAETKYRSARALYGPLGWDVYCRRKEAEALLADSKLDAALLLLDALEETRTSSRREALELQEAMSLYASALLKKGDDRKALFLLDKLVSSPDDKLAASALLRKGDLLLKRKDSLDAALCFFELATLFPKSPSRPEALFKAAEAFKAASDEGRAATAETLLRDGYPVDNPFVKRLD